MIGLPKWCLTILLMFCDLFHWHWCKWCVHGCKRYVDTTTVCVAMEAEHCLVHLQAHSYAAEYCRVCAGSGRASNFVAGTSISKSLFFHLLLANNSWVHLQLNCYLAGLGQDHWMKQQLDNLLKQMPHLPDKDKIFQGAFQEPCTDSSLKVQATLS